MYRSVQCMRYGPPIMADRIDIPDTFPAVGGVEGRRVVITGAGRGLGELLAHAFSASGAKVVLVARTEADLDHVAGELPGPSLRIAGDVRDPELNEAAAQAAVDEWGGLDAWVANAGISPVVAGPRSIDVEVWRQVVDVNLTAAFLGARAAAGAMTEGGRIIFTGSVLGERPARGLSAYSATKAAVVALAKSLALDLARDSITVNVVQPGWFDSPLAAGWTADAERSRSVLDHTALKRWGSSKDLAGAYLYLASDAADFVTGTVISVDGGYLLV